MDHLVRGSKRHPGGNVCPGPHPKDDNLVQLQQLHHSQHTGAQVLGMGCHVG